MGLVSRTPRALLGRVCRIPIDLVGFRGFTASASNCAPAPVPALAVPVGARKEVAEDQELVSHSATFTGEGGASLVAPPLTDWFLWS
jgi:hypothetical protein